MSELKPCKCGGTATLRERFIKGVANVKTWWVQCDKCKARTRDRNKPHKAVDEWNKAEGATTCSD